MALRPGDRTGRRLSRVSIVGSGLVGSTLAYSLIMESLVGEVVLVDVNRGRALGEAMDLHHALSFSA